jgi:hypothetical protein
MEQVRRLDPTKVAVAKINANTRETRQHNRFANLDRLHKTMHLRQTETQEKRDRDAVYNA